MSIAILGSWTPDQSSYVLRVTFNAVTENLTVNVTAGNRYYVSGDGAGNDLLSIIETALDTHSEVTGSSLSLTGTRVTIGSTHTALSILWSNVATTFPSWILGFGTSDASFSASDGSPLVWIPQRKQSFDTRDMQRLIRGRDESLSGLIYTTQWTNAAKDRDIGLQFILQRYILEEYALTGDSAFESLDLRSLSTGGPFRLYEDSSTISAGNGFSLYRLREDPVYNVVGDNAPTKWNVDLKMKLETSI